MCAHAGFVAHAMLNLLGHWHVCRAVLRSVVLPTREKNVCAIMFEGFGLSLYCSALSRTLSPVVCESESGREFVDFSVSVLYREYPRHIGLHCQGWKWDIPFLFCICAVLAPEYI